MSKKSYQYNNYFFMIIVVKITCDHDNMETLIK